MSRYRNPARFTTAEEVLVFILGRLAGIAWVLFCVFGMIAAAAYLLVAEIFKFFTRAGRMTEINTLRFLPSPAVIDDMADQPETLPRFDGAAAWAALTPAQQAEIGAIALEYVVAINGADAYSGLIEAQLLTRPFLAAEPLLQDRFLQAGEAALTDAVPALLDDALLIPLPSRLGPICRACACSEFDPCPEGCGWAEPDLCTSCAELAALPAASPQPGG